MQTQPIVAPTVWDVMLSRGQAAANWLMDLVFPPVCGGCGRADVKFCGDCLHELAATPLSRAFLRLPALDAVCASGPHADMLRKAVQAFKYDGVTALDELLAARIVAALIALPWRIDCIVPVPLHANRLEARGYNQSELLSWIVARELGIACAPSLLRRLRDTKEQAQLKPGERMSNVEGAFEAVGNLRGRRMLLLDDVVTTGATMSQCAIALRRYGAATVYGCALTMPARNHSYLRRT